MQFDGGPRVPPALVRRPVQCAPLSLPLARAPAAMSSPREWYFSVPPITRAWLTAAVLASVGQRFGLVNPMLIMFNPALVVSKFQARGPRPAPPRGGGEAGPRTRTTGDSDEEPPPPFRPAQVWRLVLNFAFFGRLSFNFLIAMMML